jgi:hypothetical protein
MGDIMQPFVEIGFFARERHERLDYVCGGRDKAFIEGEHRRPICRKEAKEQS